MAEPCPCCAASEFDPLLDLGPVPVSGGLRGDPAEPLASAHLAFELCRVCALVRQADRQIPRDYREMDRATARRFPPYGDNLLRTMKSFGVRSEDLLLEIGSNDGSFLDRMRGWGFTRLLGVEPSRRMALVSRARGFEVVNDYFGPGTAARVLAEHGPARVVICRHTLEHVPEPLAFVTAVRGCLDPCFGVALLEVPDGTMIPREMHVDELWDEHLYYFTAENLVALLARAGMRVRELAVQPHLDTRNLIAWCGAGSPPGSPQRGVANPPAVESWKAFARAWEPWRRRVAEALAPGPKPLYLIGASHRQCNFVNYAGIASLVDHFIDDDPAKVGRFPSVAGGKASIISTVHFEESAREGTLLLTGFGYPNWTARLCAHANRHGMRVVDPCKIEERCAG